MKRWSKTKLTAISGAATLLITAVLFAGPYKEKAGFIFNWFIDGVKYMELTTTDLDVETNLNVTGVTNVADLNVTGSTTGVTGASAAQDWLTATSYGVDELVVDTNSGVLYRVASAHTSTGTNLTDDVGKYQVIGSASSGVQVGPLETVTFDNSNKSTYSTNGPTVLTATFTMQRIGDSLHFTYRWRGTGADDGVAADYLILPGPYDGQTISFVAGNYGAGHTGQLDGSRSPSWVFIGDGTSALKMSSASVSIRQGSDMGDPDLELHGTGIIPVAEWANSGTTVSLFDLTEKTVAVDNSVLALTGPAGFTPLFTEGMAYKDSNGEYRFRFNFRYSYTSSANADIVVGGVSYKDNQAVKAQSETVFNKLGWSKVDTGSGNGLIQVRFSVADTAVVVSGDVALAAKPTWFDANRENPASVSAFVSLNDEPTLNAVYMTATTATGTPAAGKFHSEIVGRQPMLDPSKIPSGKHGVERIHFTGTELVVGEQESSGGLIYMPNGMDMFRQYSPGPVFFESHPAVNKVLFIEFGGFLEITFYGTGINFLSTSLTPTGLEIFVDGGSSLGTVTAGSSVLDTRGYNANQVYNVVSGLTVGVHTVRLEPTTGSGFTLNGIEILNEATTVAIPSGSIVYKGKRFITPATTDDLTTFNKQYQNGVASGSSTKGGHQVRYFDVDGTIKKAIDYADTAVGTIGGSDVDHSNEEVVQKFNFREFGAGRPDDFSTLAAQSDRAFTLDDGTTTLVGNEVGFLTSGVGSGVGLVTNGAFLTFTFIGTGLDIVEFSNVSGTDDYDLYIDGAKVGDIDTGITAKTVLPIVSGLPFGTHTFQAVRVSADEYSVIISDFFVYAPKKPVLADGQVEIDSTYKMADFVANATVGINFISTGVIRKHITREAVYKTASVSLQFGTTTYIGGYQLNSGDAAAEIDQTFFGTGVDLRYGNNPTHGNSTEITLNGVLVSEANFTINATGTGPAITVAEYGSGTFTPSTGILNHAGTAEQGSGLAISGLAQATYTVGYEPTTATQSVLSSYDIITPTYSYKNNLLNTDTALVGSNSLKNEILVPGATKHKIIATAGIDPGINAIGEIVEGKKMEQSLSINSPVNNTFYDTLPEYHISLSPGKWVVYASGPVYVDMVSGPGKTAAYLSIRDDANNTLARAIGAEGDLIEFDGRGWGHAYISTITTISKTTSYKMSLQAGELGAGNASSNVKIEADGSGSLQRYAQIYAIRVK